MKKLLLALVLMAPIITAGCKQNHPIATDLTAAELDSIRHKQVLDSLNNLDTIRILKTLFMGMNPVEYDLLKTNATQSVKIGIIEFSNIDTLLYHGKVHNIRFRGMYSQSYISDIDEMAKNVKYGEDSFHKVIENLSLEYGNPTWISRMSEVDNNGYQFGMANWDFGIFSIDYEQKQWSRLGNMTFDIESKIEYSIPRIETKEEKQRTDSVVNEWEQKNNAEKKKNQEAIQSL